MQSINVLFSEWIDFELEAFFTVGSCVANQIANFARPGSCMYVDVHGWIIIAYHFVSQFFLRWTTVINVNGLDDCLQTCFNDFQCIFFLVAGCGIEMGCTILFNYSTYLVVYGFLVKGCCCNVNDNLMTIILFEKGTSIILSNKYPGLPVICCICQPVTIYVDILLTRSRDRK